MGATETLDAGMPIAANQAMDPRPADPITIGRVIFCAGAGKDPHGSLFHALVAAGHEVLAPDYRGLDLATAADILMYQILEMPQQPQILVGQSFGGAVAFLASLQAAEKGTTVAGLVLCAPALFVAQDFMAPARLPSPVAPVILVHGVQDKVIPVDLSRGFAREHDLSLIEVNDGHALSQSTDRIIEAVAKIGLRVDIRCDPTGEIREEEGREALVAWLGQAAETTPAERDAVRAEWHAEPNLTAVCRENGRDRMGLNDDRAFAATIRGRDDAALEAQAVGIAKRFTSVEERCDPPDIGRFVAALEQRDYKEALRLWASFDEWARARLPTGSDRDDVETWTLSTQTFRDLHTIIEELSRRRGVQR